MPLSDVALRTYALALSLSLGPALVPFVTRLHNGLDSAKLGRVLRREFGHNGFAFSITLAVAGGAFLKKTWAKSKKHFLSPEHETFVANTISASVAIFLLQRRHRRRARRDATSPTLDLTLLLLVRAMDSLVQSFVMRSSASGINPQIADFKDGLLPQVVHHKLQKEKEKRDKETSRRWTEQIDAFVFWACSARIMWCFFYEPHRYVVVNPC